MFGFRAGCLQVEYLLYYGSLIEYFRIVKHHIIHIHIKLRFTFSPSFI